MSLTPPELERKVHQIDNDVQAIYEMLSAIDGTLRRQGNRLMEMTSEFGNRFIALESRMEGFESRMEGFESRMEGLDGKVDAILELLRGAPPSA
jgi:hypothetical protein